MLNQNTKQINTKGFGLTGLDNIAIAALNAAYGVTAMTYMGDDGHSVVFLQGPDERYVVNVNRSEQFATVTRF